MLQCFFSLTEPLFLGYVFKGSPTKLTAVQRKRHLEFVIAREMGFTYEYIAELPLYRIGDIFAELEAERLAMKMG